eukprot:9476130-Pyramimonas_sp.AAC.1
MHFGSTVYVSSPPSPLFAKACDVMCTSRLAQFSSHHLRAFWKSLSQGPLPVGWMPAEVGAYGT